MENFTKYIYEMFSPFCSLFDSEVSHELFQYHEDEVSEMKGISSTAIALNILVNHNHFQAGHYILSVFDGFIGLHRLLDEYHKIEIASDIMKLQN
ncbi:hypothetical protein [uncultured Pontibacter sp.]|uniref:hypothetical protein n=1 Tax=uncultured Pontibacter sp. TaxID=453356 RepID=UPI00261D5FCE|nr:hypothetical protein [uncultured Pontibacter sp.]